MQASLQLQRAVAEALGTDGALAARGLQVFDGPPASAPPPYISIGADLSLPRRWSGGGGIEHRFQILLWDSGASFALAKTILGEVEQAVLALPRRTWGLEIAWLRLVRSSVRRTQRNWTLGQLEFRALTVTEE